MSDMQQGNLIRKLAGRGIPPIPAYRFFRSLVKTSQVVAPDPLYDAVSQRPVTREIVDDRGDDYLNRAGELLAQQQAEVDQAKAESTYAVQSLQAVQQQSQQQLQQLQEQLQQLSARTQQAETGLAQAQQGQTQAAMHMAQLQGEAVQAGQVALEARQSAFQAQRAHQDLMQRILGWKSQLQTIVDQDPVQQLMAQQAAQEAQMQAQQQMQAMGVPPEQMQQAAQQGQQAGVPPEQAMQAMQMGQAQEQQQAQQKMSSLAIRKLAAPLPGRTIGRAIQKGLAKKIVRAIGDHPAAVLGLSAGLIGGGALTLHLLGRRGRRSPGDVGNLPTGAANRPERFVSSGDRDVSHGPATPGRSLRGHEPDVAWATPKQAGQAKR